MDLPKTNIDASVKTAKSEGHMMTLEDISKKLHGDFNDEIQDANTYLNMAKCAQRMEHHDLAHYLCEMAKDEYSHAKFIHMYLVENGIDIDEEDKADWHELEERFPHEFGET